jgi:hypothetical protein
VAILNIHRTLNYSFNGGTFECFIWRCINYSINCWQLNLPLMSLKSHLKKTNHCCPSICQCFENFKRFNKTCIRMFLDNNKYPHSSYIHINYSNIYINLKKILNLTELISLSYKRFYNYVRKSNEIKYLKILKQIKWPDHCSKMRMPHMKNISIFFTLKKNSIFSWHCTDIVILLEMIVRATIFWFHKC